MSEVRKYIVQEGRSIQEAMRCIDRNGQQVAFVVDRRGRLVGSVSDGDVRRAILAGSDIRRPVKEVMNPRPIVLDSRDSGDPSLARRVVRRLLGVLPGSRVIPVVDRGGAPVEILSCADMRPFRPGRAAPSSVRRVLVVGGAGYLGSVLVERLLRDGFSVRALDLLMFGKAPLRGALKKKGFELIPGDLRNIATVSAALSGMDAVVNLAAVVGDAACSVSPEDAIETNYLANRALAEACKYHQINRFVYASTCSVYGVGKDLLDENSALNPVSLYARSKIRSEEAVLGMEDSNFSPTVLRMATLYGFSPRMRFDLVVNRMTMTAIRDGKIYVTGGGNQWRPLLHVEDAADAYVRCLKAPLEKVKGQVFNVGSSGQNYQIKKIARIVSRTFPKAAIVKVGADSDARDYFVSFKKIEKALSYRAKWRVEKAVPAIRQAMARRKLTDYDNPVYYNVENNR